MAVVSGIDVRNFRCGNGGMGETMAMVPGIA